MAAWFYLVLMPALVWGRQSCHEEVVRLAMGKKEEIQRTVGLNEAVPIPRGWNFLGTDDPYFPDDGEGPAFNWSSTKGFWMDKFEVSNAKFALFVASRNHTSTAEAFGWSFVHAAAHGTTGVSVGTEAAQNVPWWLKVDGATWFSPEGAQSCITIRLHEPVVHVSLSDASSYCEWAGGRLPSEAEWEYAARGKTISRVFPWGNNLTQKGKHRANTWQGSFPLDNSKEDGYIWAAPVDAFGSQNDFGLYNVIGNVWEWTATKWCEDKVTGATTVHCVREAWHQKSKERFDFVKKGGSFLCNPYHCSRYRLAARHRLSGDSTAQNLGFRCVYDEA